MADTLFAIGPFALLLLALAVAPLAWPERWARNHTKGIVVATLAVPVVTRLVVGGGEHGREVLGHAVRDYVSFVAYLGALYVVATGIRIRGTLEATPLRNAVYLFLGAALASLVGTAGASVLLLPPLLDANRERKDRALPVVFFIFLVANGGGLLSPLGDPPLYLGFLRGVPFAWPLENLSPVWLTFVGLGTLAYLALAYLGERRGSARTEPPAPRPSEPFGLEGWPNLVLLALVVACSFFSGKIEAWWVSPLAFAAIAVASLFAVPPSRRRGFEWHPIVEVAVVFAGVFATLAPVIARLHESGASLPVRSPVAYFFVSGGLSSVLDNAPTYLVLFEVATTGNAALTVPAAGVGATGVPAPVLAALSCGCVLMGANTYIGNGPNLLVRSLAERDGVPMPGFFRFSAIALAVLGPIYVAIAWLFFAS